MNNFDKSSATPAGAAPKRSLWWITIVVLIIVAGGGYYWFSKRSAAPAAAGAAGGPGGGGRGGRGGFGSGAVPISSEKAVTGELRVYLSALGSVTPLNTITVRSRADGELLKINFAEGQLVKAGDLLAEIDSRSYRVALEQAEGQLARDTALLENARRDLERYQNAAEAVTQQQVDSATATVAQYAGSVRSDHGSVENYKLQLSYCRVTAPISGRVGLRLVDQGNLVRSGDSTGIVVITQEEPISVIFSIPEDNLPRIRKAMAAGRELIVDAYDRAMQTRLASGKVVALDNQIDATTGTVRLKANFANEDHGLFPNQFVNVKILTEVQENAVLIPSSAIQLSGAARFVFVVKADDTVERRTITVGRVEGEKSAVIEGIKAGEVVVTEGLDRLQNGAKVAGRTPVATKPTDGAAPGGDGASKSGGERKRRKAP
jgi:multidrug efflux system membrane fusion protein